MGGSGFVEAVEWACAPIPTVCLFITSRTALPSLAHDHDDACLSECQVRAADLSQCVLRGHWFCDGPRSSMTGECGVAVWSLFSRRPTAVAFEHSHTSQFQFFCSRPRSHVMRE